MFGKKVSNSSKPQSQIDSLIGAETTIQGDLHFSGGMRIDGRVNGNIYGTKDKASTLVLSEQGQVNGEVTVSHLVVNGTVNGTVTAVEYLELQGKARVTGDVNYKAMEIQLGAIVDGRMIHTIAPTEKVADAKIADVKEKATDSKTK
ncbi:MAG: polymer-forming cytoskeletal protein [Gallionella sp.]